MRKILFITFFLICLTTGYTQNQSKLLVKIIPSQTEVTLYSHVQLRAWLFNKGTRSITIFRQDFTAPAWNGVIENWYCIYKEKKDTLLKLIEEPSSGFNENNIINVIPGDSLLVDTLGYTFYEPGSYTFTYNIAANRRKVKRFYAMTALAKKKITTITEFNITSPFNIECKPVIFSKEKIVNLSLDTVTQHKKQFNSLGEAFKNPEEVFILHLVGQLKPRDLKAIDQLQNIHSLQLTNVNLIYDKGREDALVFDLPNLKELIIEDSQTEISDNLLTKFTKLEKIFFKNVTYSNPSKALNNLTQLKSITMTNCNINTLSADFSKLQNLVRLELNKNNLKKVPPITNLPKLEYIDIQENELTDFPNVFNNPSLKSINLARNKIATIPGDIGRLKMLTSMDLSWNIISDIPQQIGKLINLTALILTGNQISHMPNETKKLSKLKILFLDDNKYPNVDPVIFKISKLEQLVLSKNNIRVLPDDFGKLTLLGQLDIAENKISQLPKSFLSLKKLNVLKVKGNPISEDKTSRALRTRLKSAYFD